jgi:hypothetical protein
MNQKQVATWARKCLNTSWLYRLASGEFVLPAGVKHDWCFTCSQTGEALTPSLLYTTNKKVVYRVAYSAGTVDVSIPVSAVSLVAYPE